MLAGAREIQVALTCWAGSRASANTHTGVYYIQNVCGEDSGMFVMSLQVEEMKTRAEERSEEVT
jgi:hypothetical protein